ncbi:hypothetical protein GXM_09373 [Nostoc sphaeroides CCNUC1]|uniref:Uncharacterized protein n=1 Tax=Nostoc sphaeroides CCNUC1 TaxID=2653204 RepID=A0A5P8WJ71_9NOSO|nr:hypothetical protein GXM_09373 [Nostoc sphaeroides CCNUC1]
MIRNRIGLIFSKDGQDKNLDEEEVLVKTERNLRNFLVAGS